MDENLTVEQKLERALATLGQALDRMEGKLGMTSGSAQDEGAGKINYKSKDQ